MSVQGLIDWNIFTAEVANGSVQLPLGIEQLLGLRSFLDALERYVAGPTGPASELARELLCSFRPHEVARRCVSVVLADQGGRRSRRAADLLPKLLWAPTRVETDRQAEIVGWTGTLITAGEVGHLATIGLIELLVNAEALAVEEALDILDRCDASPAVVAQAARLRARILEDTAEWRAHRGRCLRPEHNGAGLDVLWLHQLLFAGALPAGLEPGMSAAEVAEIIGVPVVDDDTCHDEIALKFEAAQLAAIVVDYSETTALPDGVLVGTLGLLSPGLDRDEVAHRLRRNSTPIRYQLEDGQPERWRTEGGAVLTFSSDGVLVRLEWTRGALVDAVAEGDLMGAAMRALALTGRPGGDAAREVLQEIAMEDGARTDLPRKRAATPDRANWLGPIDWDDLAEQCVNECEDGAPTSRGAIGLILGTDVFTEAAMHDIDGQPGARIDTCCVHAYAPWSVVESVVRISQQDSAPIRRRMAAVLVCECAAEHAELHRQELLDLVPGYLKDEDDGVALFGGFGILDQLNRTLTDADGTQHLLDRCLVHRLQNLRENAAGLQERRESTRVVDWQPFGSGTYRSIFGSQGLVDLLREAALPEALWFPMRDTDARALLGTPDTTGASELTYGELRLDFQAGRLTRVRVDYDTVLSANRSVLTYTTWLLRPGMSRAEVEAELRANSWNLTFPDVPDGDIKMESGVIIAFDHDGRLASVELSRDALRSKP